MTNDQPNATIKPNDKPNDKPNVTIAPQHCHSEGDAVSK